jgi:hypothetical protein
MHSPNYLTVLRNKWNAISKRNNGKPPLEILLFPLDVRFQNLLLVTWEGSKAVVLRSNPSPEDLLL